MRENEGLLCLPGGKPSNESPPLVMQIVQEMVSRRGERVTNRRSKESQKLLKKKLRKRQQAKADKAYWSRRRFKDIFDLLGRRG